MKVKHSDDKLVENLNDTETKLNKRYEITEEMLFKIEHFHTRITEKNVISLEELEDEYQYDTTNLAIRSKLWWLYKLFFEIEDKKLFDLLFDGFNYWNKKIFSPEEFYKILFLEVMIPFKVEIFKAENDTIRNNLILILEEVRKDATRYAIANAFAQYNLQKQSLEDEEKMDELEDERLQEFYFEDLYKGRVFQKVERFNPFDRIVRVYFQDPNNKEQYEDLDWILAFNMGGGWYLPLTNFNSFKYFS